MNPNNQESPIVQKERLDKQGLEVYLKERANAKFVYEVANRIFQSGHCDVKEISHD